MDYRTPWMKARNKWVREATDADLLRVIAAIVRRWGRTDENLGDVRETYDTLLWAATRGKRGKEWGHAGVVAEELGLWEKSGSEKLNSNEAEQ